MIFALSGSAKVQFKRKYSTAPAYHAFTVDTKVSLYNIRRFPEIIDLHPKGYPTC